ncbi:MAG: alpha/beta hydrolase [Pseudomonadota bacterium]
MTNDVCGAARRFGGFWGLLLVLPVLLLGGCALWRPVTVPIGTLQLPAACAPRPDTLLVMLPGSWSRPEEFVEEGMVAAVRERGIAADIVIVDAHVGYYSDRSIAVRLQEDVIGPARARGYRQVWVLGISIGAFGALIHAEAQPGQVDGLVLLGPYLGQRIATEELRAQGGLQRWRAPVGELDRGDIDNIVWRWLQPYAGAAQTPTQRPALYLGYGLDDRFRASDDLLAEALPPAQVFKEAGGHDWAPWRAAWGRALDAIPLARDARCVVAAR